MVVTYKTVWILALALLGAISGTLIPYGQTTAIEWLIIVIIYASLMPWKYILAKSK